MGYESRVHIVKRSEFNGLALAVPVCDYDLSKMGNDSRDFFGAFNRKIDFDIPMSGTDAAGREIVEYTRLDNYGDHMKSATLPELLAALEKEEAKNHYRRLPPLIAMIRAIVDGGEFENLLAVHEGH